MKRQTTLDRVKNKIQRSQENVFLKRELKDLAEPRQIDRALSKLIQQGLLIRISYGIYAKAHLGKFVKEPILNEDFSLACTTSLNKLGIKWELDSLSKAYNTGQTTQFPVRPIVRLKNRCRRTFSYGQIKLGFENNIYAR